MVAYQQYLCGTEAVFPRNFGGLKVLKNITLNNTYFKYLRAAFVKESNFFLFTREMMALLLSCLKFVNKLCSWLSL